MAAIIMLPTQKHEAVSVSRNCIILVMSFLLNVAMIIKPTTQTKQSKHSPAKRDFIELPVKEPAEPCPD